MRALYCVAVAFLTALSASLVAQTSASQEPPPQTARQALIEMLFGKEPGHLEKHLPSVTRQSLEKLGGANGGSMGFLSILEAESRSGKQNFETFDTGPTLLIDHGRSIGSSEKTEITVERDDLLGDEDQIELALHQFRNGKEETLLPMVLRFTVSMKMESGLWRLNEASATARLPLADQSFLKALEEQQLRENEQMAQWSVRNVISAEKSYQAAQGGFACSLSALGAAKRASLWDSQLVSGKKNGYSFTISDCGQAHYWVVAESLVQGSGQKAFCSDESGTLRASSDGKGSTCIASGEVVEDKTSLGVMSGGVGQGGGASGAVLPVRKVRVSQGVAAGLLVSKVNPIYPPAARESKVQGTVMLKALINETGDVVNLELISGDPMLAPAAIDAVKQWKYKPYLLNGNAVSVETQVTVNFTLSLH